MLCSRNLSGNEVADDTLFSLLSQPPSSLHKTLRMPGLTHDATLVASVPAAEPSKRTNTLVLTQLPAPFFHPRVMDALHHHFASHGKIRAWAPLKTFSRVVVVYESEDSADEAKTYCDGLEIDATPETYVDDQLVYHFMFSR